jgi:hypothetical protein
MGQNEKSCTYFGLFVERIILKFLRQRKKFSNLRFFLFQVFDLRFITIIIQQCLDPNPKLCDFEEKVKYPVEKISWIPVFWLKKCVLTLGYVGKK